ncbi:unnamed protein product, partial [Mesorhabditis belari]|uniref:Alpha-1,3-mannosyl-glycoprotein 2-beta-N-acetylglucosaminyltransferase n=1 Tax=Mesorhabditis belari TaxID=2138241 RepID=A0AAF3F4N8_9BILA
MSKSLWEELGPIWPAGFWDDWFREPDIRKNRSCIRPEISRTAMTLFGKKGASEGLFFTKHLVKITLNKDPVEFTKTNLDYLKKSAYDSIFQKTVYEETQVINIDDVFRIPKSGSVRVYYSANMDYIKKADKLQIMHDYKAGVPRTAYQGVVTSYLDGLRVFLVPNTTLVHGYDKKWEVPPGME